MAISRKRKHAVAEEQQPSKQTTNGKTQRNMKTFASVDKKDIDVEAAAKKIKVVHTREPTPPAVVLSKPTVAKSEKKRKRSLDSVAEEADDEIEVAPKAHTRIFKHFAKKQDHSDTPRSKRARSAVLPSPKETPSKRAAALFDNLKLDSSAIPCALGKQQIVYDTPPEIADAGKPAHDVPLPTEVQELCRMHAAFLTALSLYYAHNGSSSPVNVSALLPQITKVWKKRAVAVEDLRRLLAISHQGHDGFLLMDYGRAGIRLSRVQPRGRAIKRAASYVDEDSLNVRFEDALQQRWRDWDGGSSAAEFVKQLPLSAIALNDTAEKAAPMFARGQQRLADLKASQAAARAEASQSSTPAPSASLRTIQAAQNRSTSLLDRILAKQASTASMPAGPTKQQLERKAALHRVEEIARVLEMLTGGKTRCSLSMGAMVQQLQQSLRNPISREEVERCLGLMASEITPGFVSIIVSVAVKGVVVNRALKVDLITLRERVEDAMP
ncbi:DNA replication factor Cdt1 C-terminal domain [Teratosphaeria destructans]|uniref:DNA replication factor Cdt1 C-terminal domain n=1 Tax=Teratosphaeria destructans TaxID=418781 RepID=A0A9W7SLK6_9PEZI|nr:DNA replication factor Cdt1 C-terminal domain [Teratosphaeria destructans]